MVPLLNIDSEMLPPALLWFLFSTLIDWFVENELVYIFVGTRQNWFSLLQNIDKNQQDKQISYKDFLLVLDECLTGEPMAM